MLAYYKKIRNSDSRVGHGKRSTENDRSPPGDRRSLCVDRNEQENTQHYSVCSYTKMDMSRKLTELSPLLTLLAYNVCFKYLHILNCL